VYDNDFEEIPTGKFRWISYNYIIITFIILYFTNLILKHYLEDNNNNNETTTEKDTHWNSYDLNGIKLKNLNIYIFIIHDI